MRWLKLLGLVVMILLMSGCWDKLQLEEQAYTVVLGLDQAEDNMVKVTFQIGNPQVGSTDIGSSPDEPPSDTVSFTATDILSAKELANSVVTRKISFAHLRTVIISEAFARSPLFHRIIASAVRDPELRREINLIVSKEEASKFIQDNLPKLETRPHKYFSFMQERWRDTGNVPYSTLNRYLSRLTSETLYLAIYATATREQKPDREESDYVAGEIPQESGDPLQMMGSAVLKNGKMIGKLTGKETRYVLFMRRKSLVKSFITTFPDPLDASYRVSVRLIKAGTAKIEAEVEQEPMVIRVRVPLKLQLLSTPSLKDYALDPKKQKLLLEEIKNVMEKESQQLIEKAQHEFKGDPFLWNLNARMKFGTIDAYNSYDYSTHFQNADVRVSYELSIENFGKQMTPPIFDQGDEPE